MILLIGKPECAHAFSEIDSLYQEINMSFSEPSPLKEKSPEEQIRRIERKIKLYQSKISLLIDTVDKLRQ